MARTLYLLRHAKSAWDNSQLDDFDRPLSARGHREAAETATLFAARRYQPEHVICSSARRTRETLATLIQALSADMTVELTREVYEAPAETLLSLLRAAPDAASNILLIGHNPGLEQLARNLVGQGEAAVWSRLRDHYPPAGLAVLEFDVAWGRMTPGTAVLRAFETPAR